jgi:phosphoglycolate phosphatase
MLMNAGKNESRGGEPRPLCERRCVLFDFDGTIADTMPTIVATARETLLDFGLAEERLGDLRRLVGPPFPHAFSLIYGLSEEDAREVTARYRARYDKQGPCAWPAFPGIGALLAKLKAAGRRVGVVSSKREDLVRRGVADNGFAELFDVVRGRKSDVAGSETKAEAIVRCAQELGFSRDDVVMVGDRHYDVEAAHEAGVPCVGVYFGNTAPEGELEEAGAAAVAHTVDELRALLLG